MLPAKADPASVAAAVPNPGLYDMGWQSTSATVHPEKLQPARKTLAHCSDSCAPGKVLHVSAQHLTVCNELCINNGLGLSQI